MPEKKDEQDVKTTSMKVDRDDEQAPADEERRSQRTIEQTGETETDALGNQSGAS